MISTPEEPLPGQATTGLTPAQFDELVARIDERVIWDSGIGRPRQLTLRQAVKATIMYFKTNVTEELIGELLFVDQSTISRAISDLEEIIAEALEEFVPDLTEEMNGRVVVVDGSLCPLDWQGRVRRGRWEPVDQTWWLIWKPFEDH